MKFFTSLLALTLSLLLAASAQGEVKPFETNAKQAYLIEATTGTVLFSKNPDEPVPPASLAKLMAAEVVFNEIRAGRLSLETRFKVSENAWRTGGALSRTSSMFAALNSEIRVIDLLKGMIIQSANDGAIVLGEGIAGSEPAFAEMMTKRARALGLSKSVFANSNGLPNPANKVTMRELAVLARHIQVTYPDYFKFYSEPAFEWNKINQANRNPLLGLGIGVDGMKTGFTEESGYAIVATINRNGTRLFLAMSGMATAKERAEESRRVLEWGLVNFERRVLFDRNEMIAEASVYGADRTTIPLVARDEVTIYILVNNPGRLQARIVYDWPLTAPVKANQEIGLLEIYSGEKQLRSVKVYAAAPAEPGSLQNRAYDGLKELLFFWL